MEIEKIDHAIVGVVVAVDYTDVFRYEGFAVDLADKLAGILHFNHTFRIVADKKVLMKAHHDLLFRNDCRQLTVEDIFSMAVSCLQDDGMECWARSVPSMLSPHDPSPPPRYHLHHHCRN